MYGLTRGTMTLLGAAAAGFLLWLAVQFDAEANGGYWAMLGLLAAAGFVMALSQLLGGWTKWGWPRLSAGVFLLGFLPALVAGGLVLLHVQPGDALGSGLAADLGLSGLAGDLAPLVPVIAFALGLIFGLTLDTTGPRLEDEVAVVEREERHEVDAAPAPVVHDADEPVTAERDHVTTPRRRVDELADGDGYPDRTAVRDDAAPVDRDRDGVDDGEQTVVREGGRRRGLLRRG